MLNSHLVARGSGRVLRVPRALAGVCAAVLLCVAAAQASAQSTAKFHKSRAFYSYCCTYGGYDTGWTTRRIDVDDGVVSASVRSNPRFDLMTGSTGLVFSPRPGTGDRIIYMDNEIQTSASDVLFASSDSLPAGSEVAVRITVKAKLSGSETTSTGGGVSFVGGVSGVNTVRINEGHPRIGRQITSVFDVVPIVTGGSWSFTQVLNLSSNVEPGLTTPYGSQWAGRSRIFIDALTPGVTLSSASGYSYSSPLALSYGSGPVAASVPEPGTWAMLLLGLGAVAATARRATGRRTLP